MFLSHAGERGKLLPGVFASLTHMSHARPLDTPVRLLLVYDAFSFSYLSIDRYLNCNSS